MPPTIRTCRRLKSAAVVACLVYGALLSYPRPSAALPATTFTVGTLIVSQIISLFDSGADPVGTAVLQNHELLLENSATLSVLQDRFDNFGKTLEGVLHKLDDIPQIIREEISDALDEFQKNKILATVSLIAGDVSTIKNGGGLTLDPRGRLATLQQEIATLFQRSDINAPVFSIAMAYELALLASLNAHPQEMAQREEAYRERLQRTLDKERKGSLIYQYHVITHSMRRMLNKHRQALNRQTKLYEQKGYGNSGGCWERMEWDGCHNIQIRCNGEVSREKARQEQRKLLQSVSLDLDRFKASTTLGNVLARLIRSVQVTLEAGKKDQENAEQAVSLLEEVEQMEAILKTLTLNWEELQEEVRAYGRLKIFDWGGVSYHDRKDWRRCEQRL